mmetsp:Transcript_31106/g.58550  ORF Transcript_31106/g.58550 Transcript_31106/m.58550 type:complete len:250 (+) Transcript_31106:161-910(+)
MTSSSKSAGRTSASTSAGTSPGVISASCNTSSEASSADAAASCSVSWILLGSSIPSSSAVTVSPFAFFSSTILRLSRKLFFFSFSTASVSIASVLFRGGCILSSANHPNASRLKLSASSLTSRLAAFLLLPPSPLFFPLPFFPPPTPMNMASMGSRSCFLDRIACMPSSSVGASTAGDSSCTALGVSSSNLLKKLKSCSAACTSFSNGSGAFSSSQALRRASRSFRSACTASHCFWRSSRVWFRQSRSC